MPSFNFLEVSIIAKPLKQLNTIYKIVLIIATIVGIFVSVAALTSPGEGDTNINIKGNNNTIVGTIINKVTSVFVSPSEKKDETTSPNIVDNKEPKNIENNSFREKSSTSISGENKIIYDKDFSLTGKVVENQNPNSTEDYNLEGDVSRIDIPDDGDKYYRIKVTTFDRESEASLSYYYTYNYEYKKDKFSDFTSASGEGGGELEDGLFSTSSKLGQADKKQDINMTIYVRPKWNSNFYFGNDIVEPRLTGTNLFLQLKIPFWPYGQKIGQIFTSHGHITIEEINEEEAGIFYSVPR